MKAAVFYEAGGPDAPASIGGDPGALRILTGLPEMMGTRMPRKGWLTWGNGRDGVEGSCYYAAL